MVAQVQTTGVVVIDPARATRRVARVRRTVRDGLVTP